MSADQPTPLQQLLEPLREDLGHVEGEIRRMTTSSSVPLQELLDHLHQFAGKRLRPALTCLAGRLFGAVHPEHYAVGAIIELIHTATLVHDDILDESRMRRRVDTINHRVGNETAVLLGDYLFATCFKEAASLEDRFASRYLSEIVGVVCRGEIMQVHHRHDFEMSEEVYFRIIEDKTAALYAAALRCGAHFAGAAPELCDLLAGFGTAIGTAFQIADDILDLTGEEKLVGKQLGTDLDKAKMTLPLLRLRDAASPEDREIVEEAIRSDDEEARLRVRPLLEKYGAIESASHTAEAMIDDALASLDILPDRPEREQLRACAAFMLRRSV
ncbi:MAG: polyprenyl synthetase family protein [Planctomycetota bacterium]